MNWYKKAQSSKTTEEAEQWVKNYAKTRGGRKCLIYGRCDEFADDFMIFLNDPSAETWGLWTVWDEPVMNLSDKGYHDALPYMNPDSRQTEKVIGKNTSLTNIGSEAHVAVKWNGFWWDGYGKQTLEQIMKHFNEVQNPHWFKY